MNSFSFVEANLFQPEKTKQYSLTDPPPPLTNVHDLQGSSMASSHWLHTDKDKDSKKGFPDQLSPKTEIKWEIS